MAPFRKNGNGIFGAVDDTDGVEVSLAISNSSMEQELRLVYQDGEEVLEGASEATGGAKGKISP